MKQGVERNRSNYDKVRDMTIDNSVFPAVTFSPILPGMQFKKGKSKFKLSNNGKVYRPDHIEDVAFYPLTASRNPDGTDTRLPLCPDYRAFTGTFQYR